MYICAYMRRSGLEGLRSKKFDGFWDVRAVRHIIAILWYGAGTCRK